MRDPSASLRPRAAIGGPGPAATACPQRGAFGSADGRKLSVARRACPGSGWGGTQGCWTQRTGCICIPAAAESPPFPPPSRPESRGTENMFVLVADGFYFHSLRRSDTYTAMLSPYEGQGLQRKAPSLLRLGWHFMGGRGSRGGGGRGKKKKVKFSSDFIYLNKYKYNFYIKLFTDKQPSQTQKGHRYVFSYFC